MTTSSIPAPRESDSPSASGDERVRVVTVRLPAAHFRRLRAIAVTRDLTNSQTTSWAIELLGRYVDAGGEP
jgi:hypothetical protein